MEESLHPALLEVRRELEAATNGVRRLVGSTDVATWSTPPGPDRWSVAQCIVHLNLTSEAYLPLLEHAIRQGAERGRPPAGVYRYDLIGRMLRWYIEPPVRLGVKTQPPFVPGRGAAKEQVLEEFVAFQQQLNSQVAAANGLDLTALKILSPFSSSVRYNLFSAFKIMTAHQRRHLWQAERALAAVAFSR